MMNELRSNEPAAMPHRFGVVVLAAGASARLGRPKQLLPYLGKTLIEHAVRTAIASGAAEVVVVVGAEADAVRARLHGLPVRVVRNGAWVEGMGGSIRRGVAALGETIDCAVVALCDQPKITPRLLRDLATKALASGSPIVASSYDGVLGAPCAFLREMFPSLLALEGDIGARQLIRSSGLEVETVELDGGNVDVDTAEDVRRLIPHSTVEAPVRVVADAHDPRAPPAR